MLAEVGLQFWVNFNCECTVGFIKITTLGWEPVSVIYYTRTFSIRHPTPNQEATLGHVNWGVAAKSPSHSITYNGFFNRFVFLWNLLYSDGNGILTVIVISVMWCVVLFIVKVGWRNSSFRWALLESVWLIHRYCCDLICYCISFLVVKASE